MSRHPNPGDVQLRRKLQDDTQNHNRVHLGQIKNVNTVTGTATVAVQNTGQLIKAVIPTHAISMRGFRSSWQRYMPQNLDFVKVAFGPDNRPYLLSAATWGTNTTAFNDGYAQIQDVGSRKQGGISDFVELKQGEWDMRSSGNAYIHGSEQGRLLLCGGQSKIELRKEAEEIESRAGLTIISNGAGSSIRLGEVKRKLLPTDFQETAITGATNELSTTVETGGLISLSMYQSRIGDVRDGAGLPEFGSGAPLRARYSYYDPTGFTTALEIKINNLGSVDVSHGIAALDGLTLTSTTGPLKTTYFNTTIDSTVTTNVTAGLRVSLGSSTAIDPLVKGLTWTLARITQHTAQGAQHTIAAGAWGALGGMITARLAAIPPISDPDLLALYTALGTLAIAATAAEIAHTAALTAFEGGSAGYLSLKCWTE